MEVVVYNSSTLVERDYHFQHPESARESGKRWGAKRDQSRKAAARQAAGKGCVPSKSDSNGTFSIMRRLVL